MRLLFACLIVLVGHMNLLSQCDIANTPEGISSSHTFDLEFEEFKVHAQSKTVCLREAALVNDLSCDPFDSIGVSIWFRINTTTPSNYIHTSLALNKNVKILWSHFEENGGIYSQVSNCNDADVSTEVSRYKFTSGKPIYIKASIFTDTLFTDFDSLNISTFINPFYEEEPCYIGNGDGDGGGFLNLEIESRSIGELSDPILFPGEEIVLKVDAFLTSIGGGNTWVQSVIPHLGKGWDHDYFYENLLPQIITSSSPIDWIPSSSECSGVFRDSVPILCTYEDEHGRLILCNVLTNDCPCEVGIKDGDPMPSGYYGITAGSSSTCAVDCTPSSAYGISTGANVNISTLVKLKVSENSSSEDLSFGLHMLTDEITGCWEDFEALCRHVTPMIDNSLKTKRTSSYIFTNYVDTICNGQLIDLSLVKNNLLNDSVTISFLSNDNLDFIDGQEVLTVNNSISIEIQNRSSTIQKAVFKVNGLDTERNSAFSPVYSIMILPELSTIDEETVFLCEGGCVIYNVKSSFDDFIDVDVIWDDGYLGSERLICTGTETKGRVIDHFGCDSIFFEIEVELLAPPAYVLNIPDAFCGFENIFFEIIPLDPMNDPIEAWNFILVETTDSVYFEIEGFFGEDCILVIEESRPVIETTQQILDTTICVTSDMESLVLELPFSVYSGFQIESFEEVIGFESSTYNFNNDGILTLTIDEIELGQAPLEFIVHYEVGCMQMFSYDLHFSNGYVGSVMSDISNFEVDFSLTNLSGITSTAWNFGDGGMSNDLFPTHIYETEGTFEGSVSVHTICGSSTVEFIVVIGTTSTENKEDNTISIHPNPVESLLYVDHDFNKEATAIFINYLGQEVMKQKLDNGRSSQIDMSTLISGIYFIKVNSGNQSILKRIIVNH